MKGYQNAGETHTGYNKKPQPGTTPPIEAKQVLVVTTPC